MLKLSVCVVFHWLRQIRLPVAAVIILAFSLRLYGYSVLAHEEIVDLQWKQVMRPLLLQRFPGLTGDQLRQAHAYAYGGAVIQDLGYYPFGSKEFSNLAHYVRSGDLVLTMLHESRDANEFAFAMGALAHYASDIDGHPAVNRAVAMEFPKLQARFGDSVRYEDNHTAHIQTEFGFDMVQVSKNRFAPTQYRDFIGFEVSVPLLERSFPLVYGIDLKDALPSEDLSVGSYRYTVGKLIPNLTQVALHYHKKDMMREEPTFSKRTFLYRLSRADYERAWGRDYRRPDFGVRFFSALLHLIPKIGPAKLLDIKNPTPQTENMYFASFNKATDQYHAYLEDYGHGSLQLPDVDFDTGKETQAAEYRLADDTYAELLLKLRDRKFADVSPALRQNILKFYGDLSAPIDTKKDKARWEQVTSALDELKTFNPPAAAPTTSAALPASGR